MAYHHSCYETQYGKTAKKVQSRKPGFICQLCNKVIAVGDFFTWTRRSGKNGEPPPQNVADLLPPPEEYQVQGGSPGGGPDKKTDYNPMLQPGSDQGKGKGDESQVESPFPKDMSFQIISGGIPGAMPADKVATPIIEGTVKACGKLIAEALQRYQPKPQGGVNQNAPVQVTEVVLKGQTPEQDKNLGVQHKDFPMLLKYIAAGVNVWLCGPAGSGKTRGCIEAAKALGKKFYFTGAVGDQYGLSGYMNAQGQYVPSNFFRCFTEGGIFLWDEVDASDASALLWANGAIENNVAAFPHGIFERHPDCVIVAAANTWGHGATHEYVGRTRQDAAFLNRFCQLAWSYDEALESHLAVHKEWAKRVQQVRKRVADRGLKVMVTPRATFYGDKLLSQGLSQAEVETATLRNGMTEDQWAQVGK